MRFRYQLILAFILVEALFIFAIVFLNLTALKQASTSLVSEQVESQRLLLSEIVKTPILVNDVATIDDAAQTFVSMNNVLNVHIEDSKRNQLSYFETDNKASKDLLKQYKVEQLLIESGQQLALSDHHLLEVETPVTVSGEKVGYIRFVFDNSDSVALIQRNEWISYGLALISIVIGLIAAFLLSNRITYALQRLIDMANRIARGNVIEIDKKSLSNDELGDLSHAMDLMQHQIKDRTNSLIAAENRATKANRAKSEFLSSMSHELRTPLNAVIGFSQLLSMGDLNQKQKQNISEITKAGNHLLSLINSVLDLSKIESGEMTLSIEQVELYQLIDECLPLVQPLADENKVNLHFSSESKLFVMADRVRLKQVILNLLSNAIKYNVQGGVVEIGYAIKANSVQIMIEDSGRGIAESKVKKLFQPFNRLGHEGGVIEGTGIGLTITKDLLELMQGSINYQPNFPQGSCFIVELPLKQTETDQVNTQKTQPQPEASTKTEVNNVRPKAVSCQNSSESKRILYIEDNPANLRLVSDILAMRSQVNLFTAHEPFLGIEVAKNSEPDIILLDINLPGMSGYEVLSELKKESKLQEIPIIAISAGAMKHDLEKAERADFNHYITKPIDVDHFLSLIDLYC